MVNSDFSVVSLIAVIITNWFEEFAFFGYINVIIKCHMNVKLVFKNTKKYYSYQFDTKKLSSVIISGFFYLTYTY